jgi:hypothetical protein
LPIATSIGLVVWIALARFLSDAGASVTVYDGRPAAELDDARRYSGQMESMERLTVDSFARYMDANEAFHSAVLDLAKSVLPPPPQKTWIPFSPPTVVSARLASV